MEDFIVTRLVFWVTSLITATADDAPGIYCNNKTQTWLEAAKECKANDGNLVSYNIGIGKPVANISLNSDVDIWTADYATDDLKETYGHTELCGFGYFDRYTRVIEDTFYGDCYAERYYLCRNKTTSTLDVFKSTHSGINIDCNKPVKITEIDRRHVKPGFYWTMDTYSIDTISDKGCVPPTYNQILCGAYTAKIGKYFMKCDLRRHSLCQIPGNEGGALDKSCFSEKHQPSTIQTTHKSTVETNVESSMDQTDAMISTARTSYSSTENIQNTHTGNYHSTDAVANQTKVDSHNHDKLKTFAVEQDLNLGSKVGVSVGVCLALICGITLVICLSRRYKCWKRNDTQNNSTKSELNMMSSSRRPIAHCNASYEPRDDMSDNEITGHGTNNEWKYHGGNKKPKTDLNSEYAVVHKNNPQRHHNQRTKNEPRKENKRTFGNAETTFANPNEIQTAEYSFAKEVEEDVTNKNDGDLYNITEEDYDVTGNIQSNNSGMSYNVYNRLQSEEYDSSANVRRREDCNNVYGITRNGGSESVYDSTRQVGDSTHGDNIYNQLSQDNSKDEQTCYDSTSNISKIGKVKDTDQTYGKLR